MRLFNCFECKKDIGASGEPGAYPMGTGWLCRKDERNYLRPVKTLV